MVKYNDLSKLDYKHNLFQCKWSFTAKIISQKVNEIDRNKYEVIFHLDNGSIVTSLMQRKIEDFSGCMATFSEKSIDILPITKNEGDE